MPDVPVVPVELCCFDISESTRGSNLFNISDLWGPAVPGAGPAVVEELDDPRSASYAPTPLALTPPTTAPSRPIWLLPVPVEPMPVLEVEPTPAPVVEPLFPVPLVDPIGTTGLATCGSRRFAVSVA